MGLVTRENRGGLWGEGRNKGQRRKQSLEGERPRGRGLSPRLSPSPRGAKRDATAVARQGPWPAGDTPSLFAGGWAVSQGGSQWERRRWLSQLMLKKPGPVQSSHPSGPPTSGGFLACVFAGPRGPEASVARPPLPLGPGTGDIGPPWVLGKKPSLWLAQLHLHPSPLSGRWVAGPKARVVPTRVGRFPLHVGGFRE